MLTVGFLGAAFVPVLQGRLADHAGLQRSYLVEAFIYMAILIYAVVATLSLHKPADNGAIPAS